MKQITVIGEALIDIVDPTPQGEIPGGSPANVALGLGRLGVPVEFVTWLGDDERGHRIAAHLEASHVRIPDSVFQARHTSTATVTLGTDGQPTYVFDIDWNVPSTTKKTDRLHVGSLGAFLEPGADAVRDLVKETKRAGGFVSIDPNIRPALLMDSAGVRIRFEELAAGADVVKLSDEDAHWLYPETEPDHVLDHLHQLGVQMAVLTAGVRGSTLSTALESVFVPAHATRVVDTVGAGDTYMATLLWLLEQVADDLDHLSGEDLNRIGSICAEAASITVSRSGADLPWAAELRVPASHPTL